MSNGSTSKENLLTDFGYTGQRHDPNTGGLMFYNARYYMPEMRRFRDARILAGYHRAGGGESAGV